MANDTNQCETLHAGRFIRLVRQGVWEYADRVNTSGIVMIVPVTAANEVVVIEQYRPPVGATVIELPAGLAGDIEGQEDEALIDAAKRELLEETGYESDRWQRVTAGPPSAGMSTEIITILVARDCRRIGDGGGDHSEDITVHTVPRRSLRAWLARQEKAGKVIDLKLWAGLYWLRHTK